MGINSTEVAYAFGQHGSGHLKTATDLHAPTGKIIVAITMLEDVAFHATNGLANDTSFHRPTTSAALEDGVSYFGTTAQTLANGEDDDGDAITSVVVANTVLFPKGLTVYGRWTRCKLSETYTHGVIVYYAPE